MRYPLISMFFDMEACNEKTDFFIPVHGFSLARIGKWLYLPRTIWESRHSNTQD
jgi:hypothetical protein